MKTKFTQLCVWYGTVVGKKEIKAFERYFKEELGFRVKYVTEVETLPDLDKNGQPVEETGGRNDCFFFIHSDDVGKFAVPRLSMGIRWWEDVLGNGNGYLYTKEFLEKYPKTW